MAEREIYNPDTGNFELVYDDGIYQQPEYAPTTPNTQIQPGNTPPPLHWRRNREVRPGSTWEEDGRTRNLDPNSEWVWDEQYGEWKVQPRSMNAPPTATPPPVAPTDAGPIPNTGGDNYFSGLQAPQRAPLGALNYPQFQGPQFKGPDKPFEFDPFAFEDFQAPTLAEAQAEPGFDYALQQGLKAMENSKAYLGTYRTGGTIKGLNDYARNMASQNYGQVYSRKADTYDRNRGNAFGNWQANRNNAADTYATNYGVSRDVFDRDYMGAKDTHASAARGAELDFARDWDMYAYEGDDAFRRWNALVQANAA